MPANPFWIYCRDAATYYPQLARVAGGVVASILYVELCRRQGEQEVPGVELSVAEIQAATGLLPREQEHARRQLQARGFATVEPRGDRFYFAADPEAIAPRAGSEPVSEPVSDSAVATGADPYWPPRRSRIATTVTPNYQFSGPWRTRKEFEAFQRELLDYAARQGVPQPSGWTFKVVDGISKGIVSPFWEEFAVGVPLGSTQQVQQEWEVAPGVPYPAFAEERIQYYVSKGEPIEAATARARAELRQVERAKDLWDGFLRKCDRLADEALAAKQAGVATPYLPSSFSDRRPVTKASVMAKLSAATGAAAIAAGEDSSDPPDLETLRATYRTPMGKTLVEQQLRQHPEWNYRIADGTVVRAGS